MIFESSSGSFSSSPAHLVSQMSDPAALANLCSPFLAGDAMLPEAFRTSLVQTGLVPNLKKSIRNGEMAKFQNVPKLVRIICDNLGDEGLDMVVDDILPTIASCYFSVPNKDKRAFLDLYLNAVSSIPSRQRDEVLVNIISEFASATDFRKRVLAVHLITLVRRHHRVSAIFKDLSSDRVPSVRAVVVASLPNCNFDLPLIEEVLTNAARDYSFQVRNTAAGVLGPVEPKLVGLYVELLENSSTMERALDSFACMVEANGLGSILNAFMQAIRAYPEKCATVMVSYSSVIDSCEQKLWYKCAKLVRHVPTFIRKLYEFSKLFELRKLFLKFLNVKDMKDWRERWLYARQAALFASDFPDKILDIALVFAHDEAACVRSESAKIFVALYEKDQSKAESICVLLKCSWQQRMVLAKVISEAKLPVAFWEAGKSLAKDPVSNVKCCFAREIKESQYYRIFFSDDAEATEKSA